jgi:hypothetical protein
LPPPRRPLKAAPPAVLLWLVRGERWGSTAVDSSGRAAAALVCGLLVYLPCPQRLLLLVLRGAADRGAHRAPAVRPWQQGQGSSTQPAVGPDHRADPFVSVACRSARLQARLDCVGSAVPDCLLQSSELKTETVVRARAQQVPFIVFFIVQPTGKYGITL